MQTVVQFGAGAVGRGFLGQLWTQAGYRVVFVDAFPALVDALQARQVYPLRLTDGKSTTDFAIQPVIALHLSEAAEIRTALESCAFAATAVGAANFAALAPLLAAGARERNGKPLNVLLCENRASAGAVMSAAVVEVDPGAPVKPVETVVGRMVPPVTPALRAEDPLLILAEPYAELPFDATAWAGDFPAIPGLLPRANFDAYVARKLFLHNGGHAFTAYLGARAEKEYIADCVAEPTLRSLLQGFWQEIRAAVTQEFGITAEEVEAFTADLLTRFANPALGDTVVRVAADPWRKLQRDDRLVGAALLCLKHGIVPTFSAMAVAYALVYDNPADPTASRVRALVSEQGTERALVEIAGLPENSPLLAYVAEEYYKLGSGRE